MEIEKVNVLGVGVGVLDQDRAREFFREAEARKGAPAGYVTSYQFYSVSGATRSALRNIFNRALIPFDARGGPNGMDGPIAGGKQSIRRVYWSGLGAESVCANTRSKSGIQAIFFFSGTRSPKGARRRIGRASCGNVSSCESPGLFTPLSGRSASRSRRHLRKRCARHVLISFGSE